MKYKKKSIVIEAIQWKADIESFEELLSFGCNPLWDRCSDHLFIYTLEGRMRCDLSAYVIKGISGEFYPCKYEIFQATYDKENDYKSEEKYKELAEAYMGLLVEIKELQEKIKQLEAVLKGE